MFLGPSDDARKIRCISGNCFSIAASASSPSYSSREPFNSAMLLFFNKYVHRRGFGNSTSSLKRYCLRATKFFWKKIIWTWQRSIRFFHIRLKSIILSRLKEHQIFFFPHKLATKIQMLKMKSGSCDILNCVFPQLHVHVKQHHKALLT